MSINQRKLVAALVLTIFAVLATPLATFAAPIPIAPMLAVAPSTPSAEGWRGTLQSWLFLIWSGYGVAIDPIGGNGSGSNGGSGGG